MPTITSTTTLTLTAGQAYVFLAGSGVGTAIADPGGRNAKYSIGPQQTAIGPFSTSVSVDVLIASGSIEYRVDTDGDLRDQDPAIAAQAAAIAAVGEAVAVGKLIQALAQSLGRPRIADSSVMASPPTFTESADFASGSISGGVLIPLSDARIHKSGPLAVAYETQGRDVFRPSTAVATGITISFATDAPVFEIDLQTGAAGIPLALIVDGQFASSSLYNGTPPASGNIRRQFKFNFGSRKMRRIQVLQSGIHNGIAGIFVHPRDSVTPWAPGVVPLGLLALGDSYQAKVAAPAPFGGPAIDLWDAVGYDGTIAQFGGSGYYSTNGRNNYLTRLQAWISEQRHPPSVLVPMGGINDTGGAETQAAIAAFYSWVAENCPGTLLIATGPWCPKQSYITGTDKYTLINAWIKSAVQGHSGPWVFLDTIAGGWTTSAGTASAGNGPWITGSGYVGATTGTGNADYYISSDQTHPEDGVGVDYFRRRVGSDAASALRSML